MSLLKAAIGFVATAYMNDAVAKPRVTGNLARAYCDRVGKPLLLIRGERLTDVLIGDPVKAEVTTRRAYPLACRDQTFGAVVAVNVLERLKRPDLAIREWRRVADKVFVVVPSWWAPHAWLDPGHRWVVHPDLSRVMPLWTDRRSIYLLPVSDRRYGATAWTPKTTAPSPTTQQSQPMSAPFRHQSPPSPFQPPPESTSGQQEPFGPFTPPPESQTSPPDPFGPFTPPPESTSDQSPESFVLPSNASEDASSLDLSEEDDLDPLPSTLGSPPSRSYGSPKVLTVVSTPS